MAYLIIYDGDCNLCSNLVQQLEQWKRNQPFFYAPMQDTATLERHDLTPIDCERGMIVIDLDTREQWQGADAAEKIGLLLPLAKPLIQLYLSIPGLKLFGDGIYTQVRDHRYDWFGKRSQTYWSPLPIPKDVEAEVKTNQTLVGKVISNGLTDLDIPELCNSNCFIANAKSVTSGQESGHCTEE